MKFNHVSLRLTEQSLAISLLEYDMISSKSRRCVTEIALFVAEVIRRGQKDEFSLVAARVKVTERDDVEKLSLTD